MKSYEERLPLIDKAIDAVNGDFESAKDYREGDHYIGFRKDCGFHSVDDQYLHICEFVCTRDEFEQRKRELAAKEQDMSNNWYEKGELPPAGEKVIAIDKRTNADGNKCELRYISSEVCVLYDIYDDCEFAVHPCHVEFLPLRTETDKLVEQMCNDAIVGRDKDVELNPVIVAAIERLAEHGYRKIKPMSEDEFKQKAKLLGCTSDYLLGKLYRAGCRFIEQVKS